MYCGEAPVTVEKIAECSHFIFRKVILEDGWWKNDCGPIIGMIGGDPVACVPIGGAKYEIFYASNPDVKEAVRLTPEIAQTIHPSACSIGRTLPGKKLSKRELLNFASKSIVKLDVIWIAALGLAAALIGVLLPTMNQLIYDNYIPLGDTPQLLQLGVVIATFMIGNLFFGIVKNLSEYRVSSRVGYDLQNATMYRSFFLPERFFRNYDSADLAQRILQIDEITDAYSNFFLISGLSFIFSLVYLIKMFKYSAKLSWAALGMIAVFTALLLLISISASKKQKKLVQANGEASARLYQYICAIDKIRMAGAEERAAQKYIDPVREKEIAEIEKEKLISLKNTLRGAAVTIFSMVLYYVIIHKKLGVSIGNFTGFNAAFGSFAAAILALVDSYTSIYQTRPSLERLMPIYETDTEYESEADKQKSKRQLPSLHGSFKLENVHFSYTADGPEVLKGINMEIAPGDYVGIVGKSGCGKSTLLKLLLGFEAPSHGAIMVDKINMNELDKKTYRKKLGVVLQNGSLIEGSIQENITITATGAKVEDVRRVIKAVGLEEDIKNMPMGINTMLNENTGTISGGQKQRILIARALIGKPTAILLDEATSALDNITQKEVCNTLDGISATKIVIAHRLSTIQNCNKIYVLEAGRVAEEGSYQELMKKKGLFYEMAQRQLPGEEDKDG